MPVQPPILCIFVSSTWHDLLPERSSVIDAINRLRAMKVVCMEYNGAWDEPPRHPSLEEARACHAYVGIFGGRYGSGITAEEYRAARAAQKPCFIYFKDETAAALEVDAEQEKREQLRDLKAELLNRHTCELFTSPGNLAARVTADLWNWYAREFLPSWAEEVGRRGMPGFAPYQLPPPLPDFVGRQREVDALVKALKPSEWEVRVAGISGMGGVGKTALALFVAERLRADYPHAQLFVELHSMRDESLDLTEALKRCVERLGEKRTDLPDNLNELSKIYRHNLSGKRALIVLDDAADESQVRAFMPPAGCALIITSRGKMAVAGLTPACLAPLDAGEAREMLMRLAPRIGADVADEITNLCGHLPIALRAAGSLLFVMDDLTPADYACQLRDAQTRLNALDRKAGKILEIGVEASFNISYERLGDEARYTFRHLAVFPASFDLKAHEAVCGEGSGEHLSDLKRLSLVFYDDRTSRYYLHDLVRLYTSQRLLPDERQIGSRRHAAYYLEVARKIETLYGQEATTGSGLELFDTEWENLQAGHAWAAQHSADDDEAALSCLHYADALKFLLYLRRRPQEQIRWMESARVASRQLRQRVTEGRYLCHLGTAYALIEPLRAIECYRQAIAIARETEDPLGEGNALGGLGNSYASLGQDKSAVECYEQCLVLLYNLNDGRGAGRTLTNLGNLHANRGDAQRAVEFYRQALEVAREIGDRRGAAIALCNLGEEQAACGESRSAAAYYRQALSLMDGTDELRGRAAILIGLGDSHAASGEHDESIECYEQALSISREVGDPGGEGAALGSLGNEYAALRRFDEAVSCHQQALAISRKTGEHRSEIQDLTNIGNAHYLAGDTHTALSFHFQALTIHALTVSREINSTVYKGIILWNIAQTLQRNHETEMAEIYASDAFNILSRLGHPLTENVRRFLTRSE